MAFIIYNKQTTETVKKCVSGRAWFTHEFDTEHGAKIAFTRLVNKGKINREDYAIADYMTFAQSIEKQVTKVNMMSNTPFSQPVNTPLCCDPSSETYWCM